jgi:hypothetical protein
MAEFVRRKGDSALLLALAAGHTVREAAERAGVSERTATRRLADPIFRRLVTKTRADLMDGAMGKLADSTGQAVVTLRGLLEAVSETARLGAAKTILEMAARLKETVELEQRVRDLEERRLPATSATGNAHHS